MTVATVANRGCAFEAQIPAPSALTSGQLLSYNSHTWQYQGLQNADSGDPVTIQRNIVVEIEKLTQANTFAVGDTVAYDNATNKAKLAGAGDFNIVGSVRKASTANDTTVLVALGE